MFQPHSWVKILLNYQHKNEAEKLAAIFGKRLYTTTWSITHNSVDKLLVRWSKAWMLQFTHLS